MHGFLSRDGIPPWEFLQIAREQLRPYDTVELRDVEATAAECRESRFHVTLADGTVASVAQAAVATGVIDNLPEIPGFQELYGKSVFHCPYCDGWEVRDQPLAIYGRGDRGLGLSLELTGWSRDLVLCTDGPPEIAPDDLARLDRNGIRVRDERVVRLEGQDRLERVDLRDRRAARPSRDLLHHRSDAAFRSRDPARMPDERQGHGADRKI